MTSQQNPDDRRPVSKDIVPEADFKRPERRAFDGHYVALEPLAPSRHLKDLFAVGHKGGRGAVWDFLPYGPFEDEGQMSRWLDQCAASKDPFWLVARTKASGAAMGMAAFMEIRPAAGVAEIGHIWFGEDHQRTREATEALFLMMDHVLTDCRYRRLEWKCDACNQPSRNAARRFGFRYEGTFYNHTIVKGRNRDTAWFSLIDSEWLAVRATIQRWLDSANFDADGRQRSSLSAANRALVDAATA